MLVVETVRHALQEVRARLVAIRTPNNIRHNKRCFIAIKIFSVLVVIAVLETMRAREIAHIWSIPGQLVDWSSGRLEDL